MLVKARFSQLPLQKALSGNLEIWLDPYQDHPPLAILGQSLLPPWASTLMV